MQYYEVDALLDNYYMKNKDSWEQARLIAYITAQVNSKDKLSLQDIMKFYWEKDEVSAVSGEVDMKSIEQELKQMEDILNNNNNG